jgi:alpha-amylase
MTRILTALAAALLLAVMPAAAHQTTTAPADLTGTWWNDRVFYEIFVRSFYDSDGDGTGDLRGVIEKLDYLNDGDPATTTDLGITGIWLMPIMDSPSYHGYDVVDYRSINPDYGTMDDFRALLAEAHARGIAVIIDLVINHSSNLHPWFEAAAAGDPEFEDWYVWADEKPAWRGPDNQEVWHPLGDRFYYGLFVSFMPDLNLANPAVTEEIYDISRFWLEEVGVDGFRMDAIKHLIEDGSEQENTPATHAWLTAYDDYIDSIRPGALTVGEVWTSTFAAADYVEDGEVDLVFNFDLADAMVESATRGSNQAVASIQARDWGQFPPNQYASFLTNHDQNRVIDELGGDLNRAQAAAAILLTSPGVPFIYYGEEIGMNGVKPDERIRTPMQWDDTRLTAGFTTLPRPWQPLADGDQDGISVAEQTDDPDSLLSAYRDLIRLRMAEPTLRAGDFHAVDCNQRAVYSFLRTTPDEALLVLINLDDEPATIEECDMRRGPLSGTYTASLVFGGTGVVNAPADIQEDGRFSGYVPVPEVDAFGTVVIRLRAG